MMRLGAFLSVFVLLVGADAAQADFDYGRCASIEGVSVPYEITLDRGIRFEREGEAYLRITESGQVLNAHGERFEIETDLEQRLVEAIRDFVAIGARFANHFGSDYDDAEWRSDNIDDMEEVTLELFSDSCRNLYDLKQVQSRISGRAEGFSPVIIVQGF